MVKNPPAEMQVRSLGGEDPLEEEVATHSSVLASRIPWKRSPGGYGPWGLKESDMTKATWRAHTHTHTHTHTHAAPLNCKCLEVGKRLLVFKCKAFPNTKLYILSPLILTVTP